MKENKIDRLEWIDGELCLYFDGSNEPWTRRMFVKGTKTKDFIDSLEDYITTQVERYNGINRLPTQLSLFL